MSLQIIILTSVFSLFINFCNSQNEIHKSYNHTRALMDRGEYNKALVVSDSILNALANNELNEFYAKTLLNKQIIYNINTFTLC